MPIRTVAYADASSCVLPLGRLDPRRIRGAVSDRIGSTVDSTARWCMSSREELLNHLTLDIRQTEVAALRPVDEARVVEAEELQERRVQIMH